MQTSYYYLMKESIELLRRKLWKKAIGTNEIILNKNNCEIIAKKIYNQTGQSIDWGTVKSFLDESNPHDSTVKTLGKISTYILDGGKDDNFSIQHFIESNEKSESHSMVEPPLSGEKESDKKNKNRLIIISIVIIIIMLLKFCGSRPKATNNTSDSVVSANTIDKEEIIVGALINDKRYYSWLERSFEKKYNEYDLVFVPDYKNQELHGSSLSRLQELITNPTIDLFLGGNVAIHKDYLQKYSNMKEVIEEYKDNIYHYDRINFKWIGFYQKRIGCVWNNKKVENINSVEDLFKLASDSTSNIMLPGVGTSSSHDLLIALSNNNGKIDFSLGKDRYLQLSKLGIFNNTRTVSATSSVGKYGFELAINWPHDAIKGIEEDEANECVKVSIFKEAITTVSCITIVEKETIVKKGTTELAKFILSKEAQSAHFQNSNRLPTHKESFLTCINQLNESGKLTYIPDEITNLPIDYKLEKETMDSITKIYNSLELSLFKPTPQQILKKKNQKACEE